MPSLRGLALATIFSLVPLAQSSGTVSLPLDKRINTHSGHRISQGHYKRQISTNSTVEETLVDILPWSSGGAYYVSITVGTPPQNITAVLDTGSSDLYLDASTAPACQDTTSQYTCKGGAFVVSASSTYQVVGSGQFSTAFGDGSAVSGDFATDTVSIGDIALQNVQMGIATYVNSTTGFAVSLMGVGYSYLETSNIPYPNMPELLQQAGAISSRLYSIFLNALGDATGTILFGGIDTDKFTGPLTTINLLPFTTRASGSDNFAPATSKSQPQPIVGEFVVSVTSVSTSVQGSVSSLLDVSPSSSSILPVLLDTGSSAWTVPPRLYNGLAAPFGNSIDQYGNILCSHQDDNVSVTLSFEGKINITVPAREFIVPLFDPASNQQYTDASGQPLCAFMIQADTGNQQYQAQGFLTLGDAIMRSMYVVFDLDNGQVSIAQSAFGASTDVASSASGDNIKVVQAGPNGVASALVPDMTVVTAAVNTFSVASELQATQTILASTLANAVGTATGTLAVPSGGSTIGPSGQHTATGSNGQSATGAHPSPTGLASRSCQTSQLFVFIPLMAAIFGVCSI